MYRIKTFKNGLRCIFRQIPDRESVSLGIWVGTGGRFEIKDDKGISHYLEHMLFKGSQKYSCNQIKMRIEGKGGSLNGFTSEEFTCYLVKVLKSQIYEALDILSDMVRRPQLDKKEIDKERTVILEELKMYRDLPQYYVLELLDELLWKDHPLGTSLIGTVESVNSIDRLKLSSYQKQHYKPSNIVVAVCGAFDEQKLIAIIENIWGSDKRAKIDRPLGVSNKQPVSLFDGFNKDTEQAHLALGFRCFKRSHPDRFSLRLLNVILGANMSSRLFQEVREKRGLAYSIGSSVKSLMDTGSFVVHAGLDNNKVSEAVKVIVAELEKVKKVLNEKELTRAKEFWLGQFFMGLEDVSDHMLYMGESLLGLGKVWEKKDVEKKIQEVRVEDIKRVAENIFDLSAVHLALISPQAEKVSSELKTKLKGGRPS